MCVSALNSIDNLGTPAAVSAADYAKHEASTIESTSALAHYLTYLVPSPVHNRIGLASHPTTPMGFLEHGDGI